MAEMILDLQEIFHYAEAGINRAALFSGVVLNNKNTIDIQDLNIVEDFSLLSKIPNNNEIFKEFNLFVYKNALREMIELFEQTLINLYQFLNIVNQKVSTESDLAKVLNDTKGFGRKPFPEKLKLIDNLLNDKLSSQKDFWQGIQDIRNSITHHIGVTHLEEITITIPKFTTIIKDKKTGIEKVIRFGALDEPVVVDNEQELLVKYEHINKTFKRGEIISFNNEEVNNLILGMKISLDTLKKTIWQHVIENKLSILDSSSNKQINTIEELKDRINSV